MQNEKEQSRDAEMQRDNHGELFSLVATYHAAYVAFTPKTAKENVAVNINIHNNNKLL